jgi:hypothetical protein
MFIRVSHFLFDVISTVGLQYGRRGQPSWLTRRADEPRQNDRHQCPRRLWKAPRKVVVRQARLSRNRQGRSPGIGPTGLSWVPQARFGCWDGAASPLGSRLRLARFHPEGPRRQIALTDTGSRSCAQTAERSRPLFVDDSSLLRRLRWWSDACWSGVA